MKKLRFKIELKSRHLLAIMVILCFGLIVTSIMAGSRVRGPVRTAAGAVITPFQNGVNKIGMFLTDQTAMFRDAASLAEENRELRAQIDDLMEQNNALVQGQTELARLTELYQLDHTYAEYSKIAAEVISKDPGNWYSTFVINRGTADGISVDMNVIAGGGLIGIVTETGEHWAQVRSIIDDDSNVSAMIASTSDTCIVTGNLTEMEQGRIDFSELRDPDNIVSEGTKIVTSNISTKYLTGLLIGYVDEVQEESNHLTKGGKLIPAADFKNLREVLVITEKKQTKEG